MIFKFFITNLKMMKHKFSFDKDYNLKISFEFLKYIL
jgi:hypothetical protein